MPSGAALDQHPAARRRDLIAHGDLEAPGVGVAGAAAVPRIAERDRHLGFDGELFQAVTFEAVLDTLRIAHAAAARWGQARPRIAVAGLNPHAGEGGLFGDEELRIIAPAVRAAQAEGIDARGPYAPDTVFMRARHAAGHPGEFDLVVAMTHDHGLIPVKYLGVERGVNVTLGLPFVRTSPDHGTAFDLAGSGRADPSSLVAALAMARKLLGTAGG